MAKTKKELYMNYVVDGGVLGDLPRPETKEEEYLYLMCSDGKSYEEVVHSNTTPHVKAVLHSGSTGQNYIHSYLDLGDRRVKDGDVVKVRYKFILRDTGTDKPKSVGIRLVGNIIDNFTAVNYNVIQDTLVNQPNFDVEYIAEAIFPIAGANNTGQPKSLKDYRFLLPYLVLNKTVANNASTHGIEVYETVMFINDEEFDIMSTIDDFGAKSDSVVEHINTQKVRKLKKYIKATLNSEAKAQNYIGSVFDLGDFKIGSGNQSTAKAKINFALKSDGTTEKPASITMRLFADPSNATINGLGTYATNGASTITHLEYDKEYSIEADFVATGNALNKTALLNTCRYLKPYLMLNKTTTTDETYQITHGIEIYKIAILIDGREYDITHLAEDLTPQAKSKVEVLNVTPKENISAINSLYPYAGKKYAIIGDSITWGLSPHVANTQVKKRHSTIVGELCKFAEVHNYGISSSSVATGTDPNWTNQRNPMCVRYKHMIDDADVIGVAGGINDYWLKVQLGNSAGDTNTFYGAYKTLIEGLITKYPGKKIFAMTPIDYSGTNVSGVNARTSNGTYSLQQMRDVIKEICSLYGVPVLEMEKEVGFSGHIASQVTKYLPDNLHPSQAGHNIMGEVIARFINNRL